MSQKKHWVTIIVTDYSEEGDLSLSLKVENSFCHSLKIVLQNIVGKHPFLLL